MGSVKTKKKLSGDFQVVWYPVDDTTRNPRQIRVRKSWFITLLIVVLLLVAGLGAALILYTPLVGFAPGIVDSGTYYRDVIRNSQRMDSLQRAMEVRSDYFSRFQSLMKPDTLDTAQKITRETDGLLAEGAPHLEDEAIALSPIGFGLDDHLDAEGDLGNIAAYGGGGLNAVDLSGIVLTPPVRGIITRGLDAATNHFGIDIAVKSGTPVSAMASGRILLVDWTNQTGYTVVLQHSSSFISIYKHLSSSLVQNGQLVTTGELIALSGNTGELTTGPHLHIELWHNGSLLNPLDYLTRTD